MKRAQYCYKTREQCFPIMQLHSRDFNSGVIGTESNQHKNEMYLLWFIPIRAGIQERESLERRGFKAGDPYPGQWVCNELNDNHTK